MPGRALAVGIILWYLAGLKKTKRDISVTKKLAESFSIDRKARYRGLKSLKDSGLIAVQRRRGAAPRVDILS